MYRKILVAFNGSCSSQRAFDVALQRAAKDGAEVFVLAVAVPHVIAAEVESRVALDDSIQHFKNLLDPLRERTLAMGVKAQFEVAVGQPVDRLTQYADRYGANLIICGQRGSGVRRWLLGSVSDRIERYSGCPVLVVR